jgi:hypothetical protein
VLDMPPVGLDVLELSDPDAPYGAKRVGEPPTISSTPAVVAAVRAVTRRELVRVPVRPDDLVGPVTATLRAALKDADLGGFVAALSSPDESSPWVAQAASGRRAVPHRRRAPRCRWGRAGQAAIRTPLICAPARPVGVLSTIASTLDAETAALKRRLTD